jgi:hypothetical protein
VKWRVSYLDWSGHGEEGSRCRGPYIFSMRVPVEVLQVVALRLTVSMLTVDPVSPPLWGELPIRGL